LRAGEGAFQQSRPCGEAPYPKPPATAEASLRHSLNTVAAGDLRSPLQAGRGEGNTASRSRRAFHASFVINVSLSETEGAARPSREGAGPSQEGGREDRVRAAPAVSCARSREEDAHEHTGSAEAVRPSLRNGFTAYSALSLVTGFVITIISKKLASQKLDASIGASGPHDFAVHLTRCSSKAHRCPPHPAPRP
jgi:hypothetical protein